MIINCSTCSGTGRLEGAEICHDCNGHGCCSNDPAEALAEGCPYCPTPPDPIMDGMMEDGETYLDGLDDEKPAPRLRPVPPPDWHKRRSRSA